jgi:hypothetical protein
MKGTDVKKSIAQKFNTKTSQLSARHEHYSMGSTWHIEIHSPSLSNESITEHVSKTLGLEQYQRCHATGDILSGGNTFVNCSYSARAMGDESLSEALLEGVFKYIVNDETVVLSNKIEMVHDSHYLRTYIKSRIEDMKEILGAYSVNCENHTDTDMCYLILRSNSAQRLITKLRLRLTSEEI